MLDPLLDKYSQQLAKALAHFEYSHRQTSGLPSDPNVLSVDDLGKWETYLARFSRASDLYLAKYVRRKVQLGDPAFRGTLRDYLNAAEKAGWLDSAEEWLRIRELRNRVSHEYAEENLEAIFMGVRTVADRLLGLVP